MYICVNNIHSLETLCNEITGIHRDDRNFGREETRGKAKRDGAGIMTRKDICTRNALYFMRLKAVNTQNYLTREID